MIDRVLVPIDGSEVAERALRYALEVHSDSEITVLHVVGEPSAMMGEAVALALEDDIEQAAEAAAQTVLDRAREIATEYDVTVETDVAWGSPGKVIVKQADEFDAVVLGSHAGSIADRVFVGDVAKTVVRRAPVPVTVVR